MSRLFARHPTSGASILKLVVSSVHSVIHTSRLTIGRELAAVIAILTAITLLMTYPLVTHLAYAVPGDAGDPVLNAWILGWDADRLRHGLRGLWDAPIFFPARRTLAYSEHLLGIAIFTAPFQWLTGNAILSYNVAFLFSYILAAAGMYLLARDLCGRRDAAFLAALAFAFCPYRASQISHLQVIMSGWMPIGLWALHRYFARRDSDRAHPAARGLARACVYLSVFAISFVLQALSNGYYLFFFSLPVAIVIVFELTRARGGRWRTVAELAVATALIVAALAPVASIYYQMRREQGFTRSVGEMMGYAADVESYLQVSPRLPLWRRVLDIGNAERELFPGLAVLTLAAVALSPFTRRRRVGDSADDSRGTRRMTVVYAAITGSAFLLSLGPRPTAWGSMLMPVGPYAWMLAIVPGLDGLRVPARLATVVTLGLAALAAIGAARVLARLSDRTARATAAALGLAILSEGSMGAMDIAQVNPRGRAYDLYAYRWLQSGPPGAVMELPIAAGFELFTTRYQLATLTHRRPIVNGYSGYGSALQDWLGGPGSPLNDLGRMADTLAALRSIGIRYVILHRAWYTDSVFGGTTAEVIHQAHDQLADERTFGDTTVFRLAEWTTAADVFVTERSSTTSAPVQPSSAASEISAQPFRAGAEVKAMFHRLRAESFRARAFPAPIRFRLALDGDPTTRWVTGRQQMGDEWIEIELNRPRDVALVRLEMAPRSYGDYPRELAIDSAGADGVWRGLYRGTILRQFAQGIVTDAARAPIDILLPANETLTLRLRQTAQTRVWFWSIHELSIWER